MLSYRYQPLQYNDSFRLLALHPSLHSSDPIRCTIQPARFSDAFLNYEAVSYTWGDSAQTQVICFHNSTRELHVRDNCCNALRHLRHKYEDRLLWIDAICINQDNLQERACQVRIMDEIFSRASNVLVVLGESHANKGILFEELAAADEELLHTGYCNRDPPSDAIIHLLEDFFQDPWFRRVWILQEVCSKSSVHFFCGSDKFSYTSLRELYFGYGNNDVVTQVFWPQALMWIGLPPKDSSSTQLNLWRRLCETREYLATDPKDRVFALQSLTGPGRLLMDPLINYVQSTEECFTEVAKFLLPAIGLRLITAARHPHDKTMPSWVPDWSQNLPLDFVFFLDVSDAEDDQPAPDFGASYQQHYAIRSFTSRSHEISLELLVMGFRYAQIVDGSQVFQFVSKDDAERQMRSLCYSLVNLRQSLDAKDMLDDPAMSTHLGETVSKAMTSMDPEQLLAYLGRGRFSPADNIVKMENILFFFDSLQQCRISIMDNGELIIVPEAVRPGDTICILSGAISACALRELPDGRWMLMSGDCYIFGEDSVFTQDYPVPFDDEYITWNQDKKEEFRLC